MMAPPPPNCGGPICHHGPGPGGGGGGMPPMMAPLPPLSCGPFGGGERGGGIGSGNGVGYNSVNLPGPSTSGAAGGAAGRWGPRTSCPVHSPFRVRAPNGSVCSGHQVRFANLGNI